MSLTLEYIARRHAEWLKMAYSFGLPYDDANDIVQEMYLKLAEIAQKEGGLERIAYKGDVNTCYIYVIIKNRAFDQKNLFTTFTDKHEVPGETYDCEHDEAEQARIDALSETVNELHWYNKRVLELSQEMSIRQISAATGIHYMSIFNTIKKSKEYVKKKLTKRLG